MVNSAEVPLINSIVASSSVVVSEELELELLLILSDELDQVAYFLSSAFPFFKGLHMMW